MAELETKLTLIRGLLQECSLDAVLIRRAANFAWATCGGASHTAVVDHLGNASLLIGLTARHLITDNIEAQRLLDEQGLEQQGWEIQVRPWHEQDGLVEELTRGLRLGSDVGLPGAQDLEPELKRFRTTLQPEEVDRYRTVCRAAAQALDSAIMSIQPGLTEHQIAGLLAREAVTLDLEPVVNMVAVDDRLPQYRHPLPTGKRLRRQAMLSLGARRGGLVASLTRIVYFGHLPDDLRKREGAVAHIDAHMIAATRPGRRLNQVFQEGVEAYKYYGFPGEWRHDHQGGLTGYAPREVIATPETPETVAMGQVYAWNPSVPGVRSEDTVLVGEQGNDVLTLIPRWPIIRVNVRGQTIDRPRILEIL